LAMLMTLSGKIRKRSFCGPVRGWKRRCGSSDGPRKMPTSVGRSPIFLPND
jgi:hypothetical protein